MSFFKEKWLANNSLYNLDSNQHTLQFKLCNTKKNNETKQFYNSASYNTIYDRVVYNFELGWIDDSLWEISQEAKYWDLYEII